MKLVRRRAWALRQRRMGKSVLRYHGFCCINNFDCGCLLETDDKFIISRFAFFELSVLQ
jgi:hypothetical protein